MKWRPVLVGFLLQILLGMVVMRTQFGFDVFNWLGNFAETFIDFVDAGSSFVFGPNYKDHDFAFRVC